MLDIEHMFDQARCLPRESGVISQRTFDDLGAPLFEVPFCVLDLETTGGSARTDAITEIGAVKYRGGELVGTFQSLVDPGRDIPPFITILTGITEAMVVAAPCIDAVLPGFLEFLGNSVIVGHNVRFDLAFLNAAAACLGYEALPNRSIDTLGLARRLVGSEVQRLTLGALAVHFRSPIEPNHRALSDARATAYVFHGLLERAGTLGVVALEDLLQLPTARGSPHYHKIELTEGLTRGPGVYLFRDRDDVVFYVGKAKNLRTRVRSYFYGDRRKTIESMLRELHTIDHRPSDTELEAAVTEIRLIHEYRPRYNRRSRPPKTAHWVKLTSETFPRLSLVRTHRENGLLYLGPFRSRRAAEVVQHAIWDAVPIRRCTFRPGSREAVCQPAQLGRAMCPCDGVLSPDDYAPVVSTVIEGVTHQPALLLAALAKRMTTLALDRRFEEAAWVRDRYRALARSIERRRSWQALAGAGLLRAESPDGQAALIDQGRLVAAWTSRNSPPLLPSHSSVSELPTEVPLSVEAAEEADLVWRWLCDSETVITDSTGPLSYPAGAVPELRLAV